MNMRLLASALALALATGCAGGERGLPERTPAAENERRMYLAVVRRLHEEGKSQAALAFLDDYELRHPGDPQALVLRGEALLSVEDEDAAERVFRTLHAQGIRPQADFGLAQVFAARGQWQVAVTHYREAVARAPSKPRYLNNLGYALLMTGDSEGAFRALARVRELDPDNQLARNNYILAAYESGRRDRAMAEVAPLEADEREQVLTLIENWKR